MAPRDVETTPNLESVEKVMKIPLVKDTVDLAKSTLSSINGNQIKPRRTRVAESIKDLKSASSNLANSQSVRTTVKNLDGMASKGLDNLTSVAPILKHPTPEVLEQSKEVAVNHFNILKEYVASFALSQMALKFTETCLAATETVFDLTGIEESLPSASSTVKNVRRSIRATRRAGVRRRGPSKPAKSIGEVSIIGAFMEVLGFNSILSFVGLVVVPAHKKVEPVYKSPEKRQDRDNDADEELTTREQLSPEKLEYYDSEEDPDYAPSVTSSEDSLEYDSQAEVEEDEDEEVEKDQGSRNSSVLYEDEHAKVIQSEDNEDEEPIVVDTVTIDEGDEEGSEVIETDTEHVGFAEVSECNTPQCEKPAHEDLREDRL